MSPTEEYKSNLASYLNSDQDRIFLYEKGRVALYAILKAMNISDNDEVIMPAFTCVVVPNAVIYLNAVPKYVDINPQTLNFDLSAIEKKITRRTKCIIIQNTFGLSTQVEEIVRFARIRNIFTIEDCTHGFGGFYNGRPNGTLADAAFFSSQWNKPFSTGIGGFAIVNNTELLNHINVVNRDLIPENAFRQFMLGVLIRFKKKLINEFTYNYLVKLYRALSKTKLVIGSSTAEELNSTDMPENYFRASGKTQASQGIKELKRLPELLELRKVNGLHYNNFLKELGKFHYSDHHLKNHSFLKYPIFVKNRSEFQEKASARNIVLGDWFLSMLHPVQGDLSPWYLDQDEFPNAKKAASHILNISTETRSPSRITDFIEQNKNNLL